MGSHIVVIGGGFAGLACARRLALKGLSVTLIDRTNHHLFQPLLYQVASAALAAPSIAAPLRQLFRHHTACRVVLGEVIEIDPEARIVRLNTGARYPYDALVVAAGAASRLPANAPDSVLALKSLEDAVNIRSHVLAAFEMAEHETDPVRRAALLTFAVVGGGPTGVELAGALAEISRHTLRGEFRHIAPDAARIILLESRERLLAGFHPQSSRWAKSALEALGVEVRTGIRVNVLEPHRLAIDTGNRQSTIDCAITLWAVGTQPSVLGRFLGADADGRVQVCPDLSLTRYPDVFVVGDLARLPSVCSPDGRPVPAMAASANQMGRCAADNVLARLEGAPLKPFQYRDRGQLATIGRHYALAEIGEFRLYGATAWWFWLVVHLYFLIGFRNRLAVAFDWMWSYMTAGRSARVLLSPPPRFTSLARVRRVKDRGVRQAI